MSAAEIAKTRGGIPCTGGFLISCVCAGHGKGRGDRRPSLSIADGEDGRLLVQCFAGCDPRHVLDELRRLGLLDDLPQRDRPASQQRAARPEPEPEPNPEALALWRSSRLSTADSLVRLYLSQHRAFTGEIPPSIRCALGAYYRPANLRLPGMVAGVQRPDRRLVACQVTYLRASDGAKAPVSVPRMTVGSLGSGAVRLGPAGPTLGLCEGVETGLSAMALSGVPVWCALGASRLHRVWVPAGVREVVIFADTDEPGQRAADRAAEVHTRAGRRVTIRTPVNAGDWNDVARALAAEVVA